MSKHTQGRFVWHELVTPDPKATLGFYGELLGWTSTEREMGPGAKYTIFSANSVQVAGAIAPPPGAKTPPCWLGYCTVPDVDAAVAKAPSIGGKVMSPPMDIPEVGRFAVVVDAQGGVLAPFKAVDESADTAATPPDGHFCWDELQTSDPEAALAFYESIYGYTHTDMVMGPMGTYHMLMRGETRAGGIMKAPMPGQPTAWLSYVMVSDVDKSAKRVESLKGKVIVPPADIPTVGRFSIVSDVQGAVFSLFKGTSA